MNEYIAFDSHKHYTWVERQEVDSGRVVFAEHRLCPPFLPRHRKQSPC